MTSTLTFEARYPHPPNRVWQALTQPKALAAWLMDNTFEPCVGHRFQFKDRSLPGLETVIDCQILALEPPKRLVYTWQAQGMPVPSLVTWVLTPIEGGTQLRLHHSGLTATASLESPVSRLQPLRPQPQGQPVWPQASARFALSEFPTRQSTVGSVALTTQMEPPLASDWQYRLTEALPRVLTQLVTV